MEEQVNIDFIYGAFKRRKNLIIIPALAIFIIATIVVMLLPPIYKSSSTILVEAQEIPTEMVMSTVTGYVEERMQTITQIVLSRDNVLTLIKKYNLFSDSESRMTPEEQVESFRESVALTPIQADVVNPESGRQSIATIAFELSFSGKNPASTAQVANALTSLFLEENFRNRKEKATTTYDFLLQELDDLQKQIDDKEEKIAEFKDKHLLSLPEMLQVNRSSIDRLEQEKDIIRHKVMNLQDRRAYLEGQLALIDPNSATKLSTGEFASPEEELYTLRRKYITLRSQYSDKHPDVIALKKNIDALESVGGSSGALNETEAALDRARSELAMAEQSYTDKHPEVIRLKKQVKGLEDQVAQLKNSANLSSQFQRGNDAVPRANPAYINLQTNITATEQEIASQQSLLESTEEELKKLRARLENTPRVEQTYLRLQRDYDTLRAKYQDTQVRLQAAKEAKNLEEDRIAEKLTIIEPPRIPEKPYKPKRLLLIAICFVLATGTGMGLGFGAEVLDKSVHSAEDVSIVTHYPVLATAPYIATPREIVRNRRRKILLVLATLITIGGGLAAIHFFYQPLDVLWQRILHRIDFM